MRISLQIFLSLSLLLLFFESIPAQRTLGVRPTNSGGPLTREQAAYDVISYDITARIYPKNKSITGTTEIRAQIINPTDWFVVDLDTPFKISTVLFIEDQARPESPRVINSLKFERRGGKIWVKFRKTKQPGETVNVSITYSGNPRIAPRAPWVGGFMWKKTADGSDWIVNAQQNDGADLWFPVKDHPSDEADSVSLKITVPENLFVASVGTLKRIASGRDKTKIYYWKMSKSINNYNIALNIAPYKIVGQTYKSIDGTTFPIQFFALPESIEKAKDIVTQTAKFLKFYEKYLGPYPYRTEKLGIAETPHLGMEHSTIIAYGNKFKNNAHGFDGLMLHELGHEWWGNLVTASDWRDFWIHEGFQSFMDALYLEEIKGKEVYLAAMKNRAKNTRNKQAVASRESKFAYQAYMAAPDYLNSDGDIYGKGSLILHTLRYLIGDEAFFRSLRRMAYPTKNMEFETKGKQNRFVSTDDFMQIAEEESKMDLDWFFEVYLRQPELPKLVMERVKGDSGESVNFKWDTPKGMPFPMPIEVKVDGTGKKRIKFERNFGWMPVQRGQEFVVDPDGLILKAE